MSNILQTPSSRQNEFIVPMSNLITESLCLESDFLKQIYTFDLFCLCIRCPSYTRKSTTISIVHQEATQKKISYFLSSCGDVYLLNSSVNRGLPAILVHSPVTALKELLLDCYTCTSMLMLIP